MQLVYLDHAATTPMDHRVLDRMHPYFLEHFGNASSPHQIGRKANVAVEQAREEIAGLLGADTTEIIFTSGGTESDNTAIKGIVQSSTGSEIITTPVEHHAVLHPIEKLQKDGYKPVYLTPDTDGCVTAEQVKDAITDETALVSVMHINNELGTINPISEIADVCRSHNVPFHSDTIQSVGKLPLHVDTLGVDLLSGSGHKFYGPKGVGFLYIRKDTPFTPYIHGGSQENNRRGGTLNVPGIIGLAEALKLSLDEYEANNKHLNLLSEKFNNGLRNRFPDRCHLNSDPENGLPYVINVSFTDKEGQPLDGDMLLMNLDMEGICVSSGSACASGSIEPSHVLKEIGLEHKLAQSTIRFSLGKDNTEEEIDYALDKLDEVLSRIAEPV